MNVLRLLLYCRYFGPLFVGKWLSEQSEVLRVIQVSHLTKLEVGVSDFIQSRQKAILFGDKAVLGLLTFLKVPLLVVVFL